MQIDHRVFLVHGTWARGLLRLRRTAEWCEEDSPLRKVVSDGLGGTVKFESFQWSGANSPRARLKAAEKLRERILELQKSTPHAKTHIIAHSHGGNIAFYTASALKNAETISSLICLSTPFLHVEPRTLGKRIGRWVEWQILLFLILALTTLSILFTQQALVLGNYIARDIGTFVISLSILFLSWLLIRGGLRLLHLRSHRFARQMALPTRRPCRHILILRGAADEASSALGGAALISSTLTRLLSTVFRVMTIWRSNKHLKPATLEADRGGATRGKLRLLTKIPLAFIILGGGIAGLDYGMTGGAGDPTLLGVIGWNLLGLGLLAVAVFLLLVLVLIPLVWISGILLAIASVFFGAGFALASLGVRLSAESTPPGRWDVFQLSLGETSLEEKNPLQHFTHSNPEALKEIQRWLKIRFHKG